MTDGIVRNFHFLPCLDFVFSVLTAFLVWLLSVDDRLARFGTEWSRGLGEMSLSGLNAGRETLSEVGCSKVGRIAGLLSVR